MITYYPPRYLFRRYEILKRIGRGQNFLEIGAGNLQLSQELLEFFHNGTLVDYNKRTQFMFDNLSVSTRKRLQLIITDFLLIDFEQKFDCIVACEVMEHVRDEQRFLNKIYSLLDDNGQLVLSVPSRVKYWSHHDEIVGHLRRYEKQQIIDLLVAHNFKNIDLVSYGFPFVNILRWITNCLTAYHYNTKKQWSQEKQSQESGIVRAKGLAKLSGLFVNKYSIYLLSMFAAIFNRYDMSNGYVVTARKINDREKIEA